METLNRKVVGGSGKAKLRQFTVFIWKRRETKRERDSGDGRRVYVCNLEYDPFRNRPGLIF